jgi:hypothetical protein
MCMFDPAQVGWVGGCECFAGHVSLACARCGSDNLGWCTAVEWLHGGGMGATVAISGELRRVP